MAAQEQKIKYRPRPTAAARREAARDPPGASRSRPPPPGADAPSRYVSGRSSCGRRRRSASPTDSGYSLVGPLAGRAPAAPPAPRPRRRRNPRTGARGRRYLRRQRRSRSSTRLLGRCRLASSSSVRPWGRDPRVPGEPGQGLSVLHFSPTLPFRTLPSPGAGTSRRGRRSGSRESRHPGAQFRVTDDDYHAVVELLRTPRTVLRSWRQDDLLPFFDLYSRWEVMRWLGLLLRRAIADLAEARDRLGRWQERQAGLTAPHGLWALVPRTGPAQRPTAQRPTAQSGSTAQQPPAQQQPPAGPVGTILLLPLDDAAGLTGEVEIGWHLHPDYQGRGLATEAARALLSAAARAGRERVLALTDPDNAASQGGGRPARPGRRGPGLPLVRPDYPAVRLDGTAVSGAAGAAFLRCAGRPGQRAPGPPPPADTGRRYGPAAGRR